MWSLNWFGKTLQMGNSIILARKVQWFPGKQPFDDVERLFQPANASVSCIKGNASLFVLRLRPTSTDAQLKASTGKQVDGRSFLGKHDWMPEIVVENRAT